jgi:hypothetical protein
MFEICSTTDKLFRTKFAQNFRPENGRRRKQFSPNVGHFFVAANVRRNPLSTFSQRRQRFSTFRLGDQKFVDLFLSIFFDDPPFERLLGFLALDNNLVSML